MDLIKESNPSFDKSLFLESLADYNKPVHFKIMRVGNVFRSKINGKPNFFIDLEIISEFPNCKIYELDLLGNPIINEDGSKSIVEINAKSEIISLPYSLQPAKNPNVYVVSNKTNLFTILNYGFIKKGIISEGNHQGFNNVSFDEIKKALIDLEFKGKAILIEKTNFNPYYKLVPVE